MPLQRLDHCLVIGQDLEATRAFYTEVLGLEVGAFRNGGRELRPKGEPERVQVHDFVDAQLGKVHPYERLRHR